MGLCTSLCCKKVGPLSQDGDGPLTNCSCDYPACKTAYGRCCSGDICKTLCKALMVVPCTIVTVYCSYFSFLCGAAKPLEWFYSTLNKAYAAHFVYIAIGFIMMSPMRTLIPCKPGLESPLNLAKCTPNATLASASGRRLAPVNGTAPKGPAHLPLDYFDVIIWAPTYIHTWCVLSYFWCIAVTTKPVACCCRRYVSARFFALWMALAIMFASVTLAQSVYYFRYEMWFVALTVNQILDLTVLIPITHWSIKMAILIRKDWDERGVLAGIGGRPGKVDDAEGVALQSKVVAVKSTDAEP